jgi:hypothetical protein
MRIRIPKRVWTTDVFSGTLVISLVLDANHAILPLISFAQCGNISIAMDKPSEKTMNDIEYRIFLAEKLDELSGRKEYNRQLDGRSSAEFWIERGRMWMYGFNACLRGVVNFMPNTYGKNLQEIYADMYKATDPSKPQDIRMAEALVLTLQMNK